MKISQTIMKDAKFNIEWLDDIISKKKRYFKLNPLNKHDVNI